MAIHKGNFLFNSATGQGFSESFYVDAADISTAKQKFQALIEPRLNLVGNGVRLYKLRISDIEPKGKRDYVIPDVETAPKNQTSVQDQCNACWLATLIDTDNKHTRNMYLRGCQDESINWSPANAKWQPSGDFAQNFQGWLVAIKAQGLRFRAVDTTVPAKNIASVAEDVASGNVKLTVPANGYTPNQPISVYGFKLPLTKTLYGEPTHLNGQYLASAPDANSILLPRPASGVPLASYLANSAHVRAVTYTYPEIATGYLFHPTTRKCGRVFGHSLGKSR